MTEINSREPTDPEQPERILLVDDNPTNLQVLHQTLDGRGYELRVAKSGDGAIKVARSAKPELILLDILMPPGMDGYETCRRLKDDPETADSTVIFMSSLTETEDKVRGLEAGAADYIVKPFQPEEVIARVNTHLTIHRLKQNLARKNEELDKANRFIRDTFGRYVSEEVVDRVLDSPEGLELGGEEREVTVLMSDLRGFTAIVERISPAQAIGFLNLYLEKMVEVITRYQGTIVDIIGDAIMVMFGAPLRCDDHADRAIGCAVVMQITMDEVNQEVPVAGIPELEMGIGIHTGIAVVGNIGSQQRTKYGAVGSHVNLASRIESYTTGGQVLISDQTLQSATVPIRRKGSLEIEPKGAARRIALHDVAGIGGPYNLSLPEADEALAPVTPPVPVSFTVLEEKVVGRTVFPGLLVEVGPKEARIAAETPVAPLSNLKVRLAPAGEDGTDGPELYAKVLAGTDGPPDHLHVRFTSVAPEFAETLSALRQDAGVE
jgi:class 3 adenylate cyclase